MNFFSKLLLKNLLGGLKRYLSSLDDKKIEAIAAKVNTKVNLPLLDEAEELTIYKETLHTIIDAVAALVDSIKA
jgi:hypothetical protein